jgi:hypothetical protein
MTLTDSLQYCAIIGGQLPTFGDTYNETNYLAQYNLILDSFQSFDSNAECLTATYSVKFFAGFINIFDPTTDKQHWINRYTKIHVDTSMQESIITRGSGTCTRVRSEGIVSVECKSDYPACVACILPNNIQYTLKGLCTEATG